MRKYIDEVEWSYKGNKGVDYWHLLNEECAAAGNGKEQSPINIITERVHRTDSVKAAKVCYNDTVYYLGNTGNTIELVPQSKENYIELDNIRYILNQVHFHKPSEHHIDGKEMEMEVHLVHRNDKGEVAVVGVFLIEGRENKLFKEAFLKLPKEKTNAGCLIPLEQQINLYGLVKDVSIVYSYQGSLTTPPCTEGVKWNIYGEPAEVSLEQIRQFQQIYDNCNRPIQEMNDRVCYLCEM